MKFKNSLSFLIPVTIGIFLLSGCADDFSSKDTNDAENIIKTTETANQQENKIIEYITVEPPENGWTTEEIMNVTYFCDYKLSYPLSVEYLGNDFKLSHYSKLQAKKRLVPATLSYKDKQFANATVVKPDKETMIYNIVLFPDICKVENVEPFVINGVKMYDSFEDTLNALGDNYNYKSDDCLMYNDKNTNESLYSLFFEDDKLVHINVGFKFDIDLPLYRNLR